jgi:hypothetical protein
MSNSNLARQIRSSRLSISIQAVEIMSYQVVSNAVANMEMPYCKGLLDETLKAGQKALEQCADCCRIIEFDGRGFEAYSEQGPCNGARLLAGAAHQGIKKSPNRSRALLLSARAPHFT